MDYVLATSNIAYIIVGLAVPVFGFLGLWIQSRKIKTEVSSPNGMRSGDALYESRKMLIEVREQLAEVREGQIVGWERAHADTEAAQADRVVMHAKIERLAAVQEDHLERDDVRFRAIYQHLELDDPYPGIE